MATIDGGGVVTAIGPGTASIKATAQGAGVPRCCRKNNVRNLSVEPATTNAKTGDVVHFTAEATGK